MTFCLPLFCALPSLGETALHVAIAKDQGLDMVRLLVEKAGAKVMGADGHISPLMVAAHAGNTEVRSLIPAGRGCLHMAPLSQGL